VGTRGNGRDAPKAGTPVLALLLQLADTIRPPAQTVLNVPSILLVGLQGKGAAPGLDKEVPGAALPAAHV